MDDDKFVTTLIELLGKEKAGRFHRDMSLALLETYLIASGVIDRKNYEEVRARINDVMIEKIQSKEFEA